MTLNMSLNRNHVVSLQSQQSWLFCAEYRKGSVANNAGIQLGVMDDLKSSEKKVHLHFLAHTCAGVKVFAPTT